MLVLEKKNNSSKRKFFSCFSIVVAALIVLSGILFFIPDAESKTGGPDGFGYRWIDSNSPNNITYNWLDGITGGTNLNLGNQQNSGFIDMGFNFPYYTSSYSNIAICDNGWASFLHTYTTTSDTIPSTSPPNAVIAPFWYDLDPTLYSGAGNVYYKRMNTSTPKHFIITWDSLPIYTSPTSSYDYNQTFQVVLYENGSILMQYKAINMSLSYIPIIGMENDLASFGLQYPASSLTNQSAVMFYYNYPQHDIVVKDIILPGYASVNEMVQVRSNVHNFGLNDEININVSLKVNNLVVNWTVFDLDSFSTKQVMFDWKPTVSNNYTVEIVVKNLTNEDDTTNNKKSQLVDVRAWQFLMLDRSHGGWMGFGDYDTFFAELKKINVIVEEFYSGPFTDQKLERYSIVMGAYFYYAYSSGERTVLQNYLNSGNGFFIMGRNYDHIYNPLTTPYEITWSSHSGGSGTTSAITPHEITTNITSLYLNWLGSKLDATGAAKVIVKDNSQPSAPALAISNESQPGRVACLADPYCFVEWNINRANNKVLGLQLIEWLLGDTMPPNRPRGFKVNNGKVGNQVNLSWIANTEKDLNGYFIYRGTSSGVYNATPVAIAASDATSYKDMTVVDNTKYFYAIAAVDEVPNISTLSFEASTTPSDIIAPMTPMNFTVMDLGTGFALKISWNKNKEPDVVDYHLYKSTNINGPFNEPNFTVSKDVNSYVDEDILEGITYYYKLSAVDEVPNESILSIVRKITPYDRIAPAQAKGFTVMDSGLGNTLTLNWHPNQEDDLVDYLIERKDNKGNTKNIFVLAPATYYNDTHLVDGRVYKYRIYARDNSKLPLPNKSPPTDWVSGTPSDKTPPDPPQNFTIIDESYSTGIEQIQCLNLTWNISNQPDLRGFKIYKSKFLSFNIEDDKLIAELNLVDHYKDYDVEEGNKYYYKIVAFDEIPNDSLPSLELWGIPGDVTPPPTPQGFKVEAVSEGNAVKLTWDLQIDTDIEGFRLFYSMNESGEFELIGEFDEIIDTYKHENMIDDQIYHFKLQTFDDIPNYSPFTPIISIIPSDIEAPDPPRGLRLVRIDVGNSVRVIWKENDESDLSGYRIYRGIRGDNNQIQYSMIMAVDKNTTEVTDTYLQDGEKYSYYITAIDEVPNESGASMEKEIIPDDDVAPTTPEDVRISLTDEKEHVMISWVQTNKSDVESYRIFRSLDGKRFEKLADVSYTESSYKDTTTEPNTKYYYRVSALDEVPNTSPVSETVEVDVPEKQSTTDLTLVLNIGIIVIIIIIILAILLVVRSRRAKKQKESEPPEPPASAPGSIPTPSTLAQGPSASPGVTQPGMSPQKRVITPLTPMHGQTKTITVPDSIPSTPTTPSFKQSVALSTPETRLPGKPKGTDRKLLPPAIGTEPELPVLEGEFESKPDIGKFEPPETLTTPPMIEEPDKDIDVPEPIEMVQPVQVQTITLTPPPLPLTQPTPAPLPMILIPVDEDELDPESDSQTGAGKKQPTTILNPLLHNIPRTQLKQPPEGIVVKPKVKKRKAVKRVQKKAVKQVKKTKQPEQKIPQSKNADTDDDIKKILEECKTKSDAKSDNSESSDDDDIKKILEECMKESKKE